MIFKNRHEKNFTSVSNEMLYDKTISFKARGLLAFMLSRPTDWQFYSSWIESHSNCDGGTAIGSGIHELIKAGYVTRQQTKGADGKWEHCAWDVWEVPHIGNPQAVNPQAVKRCAGNPPLLSTEGRLSTEKKISTDINKGIFLKSKKEPFDPVDLPTHLGNNKAIKDAWERFVQSRQEKKQKITLVAYKMLVKKMLTHSPEEVAVALDKSSERGYAGVFYPDDGKQYVKGAQITSTRLDPDTQQLYDWLVRVLGGPTNVHPPDVVHHVEEMRLFLKSVPKNPQQDPSEAFGEHATAHFSWDVFFSHYMEFLASKQRPGYMLQHFNGIKIGGQRWNEFIQGCERRSCFSWKTGEYIG